MESVNVVERISEQLLKKTAISKLQYNTVPYTINILGIRS